MKNLLWWCRPALPPPRAGGLKTRLLVIAGLVLLIGLTLIADLGYYPAMSVNGFWLSQRQVEKNLAAAGRYEENFVRTYRPLLSSSSGTVNLSDLKAAVLSSLVDQTLIHRVLKADLGPRFESLVHERLNEVVSSTEIFEAGRALYGLDREDFKEIVLVPQAERDLLTSRLFLKSKKLSDWLDLERRQSQVRVFSDKFYWDGERVAAKK